MNSIFKKIRSYYDYLWVVGVWVVVFSLPMVILRDDNYINWLKVFRVWRMLFPYLLMFIINHFILVPYFLFNKKILPYFISALLLVSLLTLEHFLRPFSNTIDNLQLQPKPADAEINSTVRGPNRQPYRIEGAPHQQKNADARPTGQLPPRQQPPGLLPPFVNVVLVSFLILGFDTGIKSSIKWVESEKEKTEIENENIQNQLAFLKNQISPHFFMNTLNNIHSLIDIDSEEAKEAIIKLSKLMRYLLYESEEGEVPIDKEIEFMQSYVNLMQLRFSEKVNIDFNISGQIPNKKLPPMLFISLIENAFKHGISYQGDSFVLINLLIAESRLVFEIKNKIFKPSVNNKFSGIGIENTKKRLKLLYGNAYQFNVNNEDNIFLVNLSIPI